MDSQEVQEAIAAGEGSCREFKSSFRYDYNSQNTNKALGKPIAKTISAFCNSNGGVLLIGVADDGNVVGIENDIQTLSKKSLDGFELALRGLMGRHLGPEVSASVGLSCVTVEGRTVAALECEQYFEPVFFRDGEKQEFYIRDGNSSRPLSVQGAHTYIANRFTTNDLETKIEQIVRRSIREEIHPKPAVAEESSKLPPWLNVATRRVVESFLSRLSKSTGWKKIFIVSPWISVIDANTDLPFELFLKRVKEYGTTLYVVTRPPEEEWHEKAINLLGATGRANVVTVPELHSKLYSASTDTGAFVLLGSANFTQRSLLSREIGVVANSYGTGKVVVKKLEDEAAQIYRSPGRKFRFQASLPS